VSLRTLHNFTAMKRTKKLEPLKCPCCNVMRSESEYLVFILQFNYSVRDKFYCNMAGQILGNVYWIDAKKNAVDWACDKCLHANRAIKGTPGKQLYCDFPPHFSYFDKASICRDCKTEFIFSKEEQLHWYETLKFWVQSTKVRCRNCQALKKSHELLSQLLVNPDYNDLSKIKQIIKLRIGFKQYRQAKHFLALGKKHHIKGSEAYQVFDDLREQVKEAENLDLNL
jgi:hypothetical protein